MRQIDEFEMGLMSVDYIGNQSFTTKVVNGINEVCRALSVTPMLSSATGYVSFDTCELKLKECYRKTGYPYPSDEAVVQSLPFTGFPRLPTWRFVGRGTETLVEESGTVGFVLGLVAFGIGKYYEYSKKEETKRKNRITNFVLVYNELISHYVDK
jgi:hypothetical protein